MCLAVPGEVISIEENEPILRKARVDFGGVVKEISLAMTPEAQVGNYVLVHAGIAITIINEEEAEKTFDYLAEIAEIEAQQDASP